MPVNGLNHINIVTADLPATIAFYESVLGMEVKPLPMAVPEGVDGRWVTDSLGQPIIHIQAYNPARHGEKPGGPNGTIDHVALTCADFDGIRARWDDLGIDYGVNDRQFGGMRQLHLVDPNDVHLELNFVDE